MCKQFFFFSSRRRHTRYIGDWSSDVCSSDLFERASVPLPTIANVTIPIVGRGTDARSNAALAALRDRVVPETVGAVPGVEAGVTGLTAEWKDQQTQMTSKLPLVVGFVLLFAFCLMLFAFRSIVVAVKAIALNLLSVGAASGVLTLVFQHGVGKGVP